MEYQKALRKLTMTLGYALREEYLKDEDILNSLDALNELVALDTPKAVKTYTDSIGDGDVPGGTKSFVVCVCPNCESELDEDEEYNFCPWCGQAISWWKESNL